MQGSTRPPNTVYHGTDSCFTRFNTENCLGAHFGTRRAAVDRLRSVGKLQIDFQVFPHKGRWWVREETYSSKAPFEHGPFDDENAALNFIEMAPKHRQPLAFEIDVYRPLVLPDLGTWTFNDVLNHIGRHMRDTLGDDIENAWGAWNRSSEEGWRVLKAAIRSAGFDCIAYTNETEDPGSTSWIVLDADKIHAKWQPGGRAQQCPSDDEPANPDEDEDAEMSGGRYLAERC